MRLCEGGRGVVPTWKSTCFWKKGTSLILWGFRASVRKPGAWCWRTRSFPAPVGCPSRSSSRVHNCLKSFHFCIGDKEALISCDKRSWVEENLELVGARTATTDRYYFGATKRGSLPLYRFVVLYIQRLLVS
ncbi:unnamed protein product [Ectocarpus sp. 13 AM-2016]